MNLLADKHKNTVDFDLKSTVFVTLIRANGGEYRDRTGDLLHAMQALSQLSYTTVAVQQEQGVTIQIILPQCNDFFC